MHELQVTDRILAIVLRYAATHSVTKVVSIQLKVGELSGFEDEWIQKYFDYQICLRRLRSARVAV